MIPEVRWSHLKQLLNRYVFFTDRSPLTEAKFRVQVRRQSAFRIKSLVGIYGLILLLTWPTDFLLFEDVYVLKVFAGWRLFSLVYTASLFWLVGAMNLVRERDTWFLVLYLGLYFGIAGYLFGEVQGLGFSWFYLAYMIPIFSVAVAFDVVSRFLANVLVPFGYVGAYILNTPETLHFGPFMLLMASSVFLFTVLGHSVYYLDRVNFFKERALQKKQRALHRERQRAESLLRNALPPSVVDSLKRGEDVSERFHSTTVLFADIVNFTPLAQELPAEEVVSLLDDIFCSLDDLVSQHGLEKIKTIGDEYFVAAGVPDPMDNHAVRMARFALSIRDEVTTFERGDGRTFEFRIGMHTGPLVAGVIGNNKFAYDVWGNTVNLGSRMESQGVPGKIQVTPATRETIREQDGEGVFSFEKRGTIEVKGRGEMTTFFLEGNHQDG